MRLYVNWWLLLAVTLAGAAQGRRIRVIQPRGDDLETIQYYAAEPQQDEQQQQQVVLVSAADQYNGLYGQPTASARLAQADYVPASRKALAQQLARVKEPSRAPPVQTIRNYNKVNDDGSFTFGYEAADGSFKEETRGTDCVVRGKYGYVDPDGNKREFTYVSGNPCDPNAPKDEAEEAEEAEQEASGGPDNYPQRPIRPIRPTSIAPKTAVTLFQNNYEQGEEEQPEPEQVLTRVQPRRPTYISRQQHYDDEDNYHQRAQLIPSTTPSSVIFRQSITPISITPRPITNPTPAATARSQLPATTYRPQLIQLTVTPRPNLLYTKQYPALVSSSTHRNPVDFDAEFQKFQQENNILAPTPGTIKKPAGGQKQIYSSALVYDPATGQYNTQLYQTLPQTGADISLNHRIQPYVHQPQAPPPPVPHPQPRPIHHLTFQQPQSQLYTRVKQAPQTVYQNQQSELQFQNSVQLLAQQQRTRNQQHHRPTPPPPPPAAVASPSPPPHHQVYYLQPVDHHHPHHHHPHHHNPLAAGQIDAFLRGHNIAF